MDVVRPRQAAARVEVVFPVRRGVGDHVGRAQSMHCSASRSSLDVTPISAKVSGGGGGRCAAFFFASAAGAVVRWRCGRGRSSE